jgi:hypothetical protein
MTTRRAFLAAAGVAGAGLALSYSIHRQGKASYAEAVAETWRHSGEPATGRPEPMRDLVRYATLAPSSHNTQCWRFRVAEGGISILPDFGRRCPVVDPDDHHLFVSLGCAAENLIQAAAAAGLDGQAALNSGPEESVGIALTPAKGVRSALFEAIPHRQSTRSEYDGMPLTGDELRLLETAGTGRGVRALLITERQTMETLLELVIQGNTAQMRDPAFVAELKDWIRFSHAQAVRKRDGLASAASGNPSLPPWLGRRLFDLVFTESAENDKYARHLRSSAGVAVFVSEVDDKAHWVEAGRAFQRFALQATVLGIRTAHLNQPAEVPALRAELASTLGLTSGRPDLVIRFGRGPELPRSLRRPVEAVLV